MLIAFINFSAWELLLKFEDQNNSMWTLNLDHFKNYCPIISHGLGEYINKMTFLMQLIVLVHEIKNHKKYMFFAWSIHHPINNWSFVIWCRSKKALKCSWLYFFSRLKYMLYNSTQQILTEVTKSHTKCFVLAQILHKFYECVHCL